MPWKCELQLQSGHWFFTSYVDNEQTLIAIADQSIRVPTDPRTTDDGLLTVDRRSPVVIDINGVTTFVQSEDGQIHVVRDGAGDITLIVPFYQRHGVPMVFTSHLRRLIGVCGSALLASLG